MHRTITRLLAALSLCLLSFISAKAELDYAITKDNISDYFDCKDDTFKLKDFVPVGRVLDFQGDFEAVNICIDKLVYIISSTSDATFTNSSFKIVKGADGCQISSTYSIDGDGNVSASISFLNTFFLIEGVKDVLVEGIHFSVLNARISSGIGNFSINGAPYTTVENSLFEVCDNGGTAFLVVRSGSSYTTIDNNVFEVSGTVGNTLYVTTFNPLYPTNSDNLTITNNVINHPGEATGLSMGIVLSGRGHIVENNTITYKGNCITTQAFSTITDCFYKNNIINGGGSMSIGQNCIAENNTINDGGSMTLGQNSTAKNNTINGKITMNNNSKAIGNTVSDGVSLANGANNVIVSNNQITGDIAINKNNTNTTIASNTITGSIEVKSSGNTISGNTITTTDNYAVSIVNTSNNTITNNTLTSSEKEGNGAVSSGTGTGNVVDNEGVNVSFESSAKAYEESVLKIILSDKKNNVNISVKDEYDNELYSGKQNSNSEGEITVSYIPTTNGVITFALSFGDNTDSKYVSFATVDRVNPALSLSVDDVYAETNAQTDIVVNLSGVGNNAITDGTVLLSFDDDTPDTEITLNGETQYTVRYDNTAISKFVRVTARFLPSAQSAYNTRSVEAAFTVVAASQPTAVDDAGSAAEITIRCHGGVAYVSGVADNSVCKLYDNRGVLLASETENQGVAVFDIPSKGIYMVEIISNGRKTVKKFVAFE